MTPFGCGLLHGARHAMDNQDQSLRGIKLYCRVTTTSQHCFDNTEKLWHNYLSCVRMQATTMNEYWD